MRFTQGRNRPLRQRARRSAVLADALGHIAQPKSNMPRMRSSPSTLRSLAAATVDHVVEQVGRRRALLRDRLPADIPRFYIAAR